MWYVPYEKKKTPMKPVEAKTTGNCQAAIVLLVEQTWKQLFMIQILDVSVNWFIQANMFPNTVTSVLLIYYLKVYYPLQILRLMEIKICTWTNFDSH